MALNFSSCSDYSTSFLHADEEFYRSKCEISPLVSGWETGNGYGYIGGDSGLADVEGSCDPADLLPDDPFGMGLDGNMEAAIASFLGASGGDLLGWTLLYSPEFQFYHGYEMEDHDDWVEESFTGLSADEIQDGNLESSLDMTGSLDYNHAEEAHSSGDESLTHEALLLSLGYLGIRDLLLVERVCKSLRLTVQTDTLLWRCIHIDSPLSEKMSDDDLLRLTQRAQGNLQCLSLAGCSIITDAGLKRVLDANPRLRKLSLTGCLKLSLEGIIRNLKAFQSQATPGIEHLKLGRLFSVSEQQYEELKLLLGVDHAQPQNPRFYHTGCSSPACNDDCVIDIDLCPVCQRYKNVYDCPLESCQGKGPKQCRACHVCIARCVHCGKCIRDCDYDETFCFEYLCLDCRMQRY